MIPETIEEARENMQYAFEDLDEVRDLITAGNFTQAYHLVNAITATVERNTLAYPVELLPLANDFTKQVALLIMAIIDGAKS